MRPAPQPDNTAPASAPQRYGNPEAVLERLNQLQSQLDQLHQGLAHTHRLATLGTLSAIVAHEFNNILTPIINYAQLALAREDDQALMRKAVSKSLDGAERAARICESMLGFAHQDENAEGQTPVRQVRQIIAQSLECMAREPRKDAIDLHLQIDVLDGADENQQLAIPPVALQQVMVNLILNARRAMGKKGGRLTIAGSITADHHLQLIVQDTGPGVPESVRERIFEPFVTSPIQREVHANEQSGTGLGLSICQQLIQRAGGQIQLQDASAADTDDPASAPASHSSGATFVIRLPIS